MLKPSAPAGVSRPQAVTNTYFLLSVIGLAILPHSLQLPAWCSLFVAFMLLWRASVAKGLIEAPGRALLGLLLVLSVGAIALTFHTLIGTEASVTLVVVLLSLKVLEMRTERDTFVIFFLGFFTVLIQFLYSQSLLRVAGMLLATLGLLSSLVLAHMPGKESSLREAIRTAWKMAVWGLPLMALLFVLFPRIGPLWAIPDDKTQARTGLTDTMSVGSVAELAQDNRIAMRVNFDNQAPPREQMYFRVHVLNQFDGQEWTSAQTKNPTPANRDDWQVDGAMVSYEVSLEPHGKTFLPVLDLTPVAPRSDGMGIEPEPDMRWRGAQAVHDQVRYRASSAVSYRYGLLEPAPSLAAQTRLPAGLNPRLLAWATEIRKQPQMAAADAQGLSTYLLRHLAQGHYRYTLQPGTYGKHVADEFWFDRKSGFCEHFASAYVIAMRAMQVPARIVTGYQGAQRNGVDGLWTVRQSDAHAWAEFWQQDKGWVRVDPTASSAPYRLNDTERMAAIPSGLGGVLGRLSPGLWLQMRDSWEAINHRWSTWVTNYGSDQQLQFLRHLGFESPSEDQLILVLAVVLGLSALAGTMWTRERPSAQQAWQQLQGQLLTRLRRCGLAVGAHQTPRSLARALQKKWGNKAEPVCDWLERLEQARYRGSNGVAALPGLQRELRRLSWAQLRK